MGADHRIGLGITAIQNLPVEWRRFSFTPITKPRPSGRPDAGRNERIGAEGHQRIGSAEGLVLRKYVNLSPRRQSDGATGWRAGGRGGCLGWLGLPCRGYRRRVGANGTC